MFGSQYAHYPDLLMKSMSGMNRRYRTSGTKSRVLHTLQELYVKFFGIPEIGFQLRFQYFHKALLEIKNAPITKILDMGSGIGIYAFYLASLYPKAHVDGWDTDSEKISFSDKILKKLNLHNVSFYQHDITRQFDLPMKYDFIVTIDVLEHINRYRDVFKVMNKLLKKNGYLYIHTPQEKQRRFFRQFESWSHEDHVRTGFDPERLTEEIRLAGFKVIWKKETFGVFGKIAWEIHHIALAKSFILAGITFPFLYVFALLDTVIANKEGLGIAILAKKQ